MNKRTGEPVMSATPRFEIEYFYHRKTININFT
jgi:hypothetical protein